MAWFKRYPFGDDVTHSLLAVLTAEMANRWRGKGEKVHEPKEYMPDFSTPVEQSPEQMKHILRGVLGATRGRSKNH